MPCSPSLPLIPLSRFIQPAWSSGVDKYCKCFLAGGERRCLSLRRLFLHESTAAGPASRSGLVVRGGHLRAPTTVTACHRTFEVVPDFPVCLKSPTVYAAARPASPPAGPFHDGASRQGPRQTATEPPEGSKRKPRCHFCLQGLLDLVCLFFV